MTKRERKFYNAKTVVIYGATGGLGKALCAELYGQVGKLILVGRNKEKLQNLQQGLHHDSGMPAQPKELEIWPVTEPVELAQKVRSAAADGLIVATGKTFYQSFAAQETKQETAQEWQGYQELLKVNVEQVLQLALELLPYLRQKRGFFHIAGSYTCIFSVPYQAVYSASKAALLSFVQAVSLEQEADFGKAKVHGLLSISLIGGMATDMYYSSDLHKQFAAVEALVIAPPHKIAKILLRGICRGQKIVKLGLPGALVYHLLRRLPAAWLSYIFLRAYRPKS